MIIFNYDSEDTDNFLDEIVKYIMKGTDNMRTKNLRASEDLDFFTNAFKNKTGRTPNQFINQKIKTDSPINAVEYLFNIVAAEVTKQNNCQFFDFQFFYGSGTQEASTEHNVF